MYRGDLEAAQRRIAHLEHELTEATKARGADRTGLRVGLTIAIVAIALPASYFFGNRAFDIAALACAGLAIAAWARRRPPGVRRDPDARVEAHLRIQSLEAAILDARSKSTRPSWKPRTMVMWAVVLSGLWIFPAVLNALRGEGPAMHLYWVDELPRQDVPDEAILVRGNVVPDSITARADVPRVDFTLQHAHATLAVECACSAPELFGRVGADPAYVVIVEGERDAKGTFHGSSIVTKFVGPH